MPDTEDHRGRRDRPRIACQGCGMIISSHIQAQIVKNAQFLMLGRSFVSTGMCVFPRIKHHTRYVVFIIVTMPYMVLISSTDCILGGMVSHLTACVPLLLTRSLLAGRELAVKAHTLHTMSKSSRTVKASSVCCPSFFMSIPSLRCTRERKRAVPGFVSPGPARTVRSIHR